MKTAPRFPTGYPSPLGFCRFTFWESFKSLSRTRVYEGRVAPHQSERSERAADAMHVPTAQRVAGTPPQVQELGPLPPRLGADGRMVGWLDGWMVGVCRRLAAGGTLAPKSCRF